MKISDLTRNAIVNAFTAAVDGGAGAATIAFRTGAAPTNTTDADSGTLLATCTFSDPSFPAAAAGSATANAIASDTSVDATGTAAHWRIKTSAGTVIAQGDCGTTTQDIVFNSVSWIAGGTVAINSIVVAMPAGT